MSVFSKLSLSRRFMLVSFAILLTGMITIGLWIGQQIRQSVIHRTAAVTSLYMNSLLGHHLTTLSADEPLAPEIKAELDELLTDTLLGQEIVSFKLWVADSKVIFSPDQTIIGKTYDEPGVARAFTGEVVSEISELDEPEHEYEAQSWNRLILTYIPIRIEGNDEITIVAEFYQTPDSLDRDIRAAQFRSWLVVGAATLVMYMFLNRMVGKASSTIVRQQKELQDKISQLQHLLEQNEELASRVRQAASNTTALNEQFLRRISSDLHDGPAQDIALALFRIQPVIDGYDHKSSDNSIKAARDFKIIQEVLESALREVREISAGLRLPDLTHLSLPDTIHRVCQDYTRKTNVHVTLSIDAIPENTSLPIRIALYRIIQEALNNGYHHAGGKEQVVRARKNGSELSVQIENAGSFDPAGFSMEGHLGLITMQERAKLLGGSCEIESDSSRTTVSLQLPLHEPEPHKTL